MTLLKFDKKLKKINSKKGWAFICDGSPLECNVFIVGLNPSTSTSFQKHWHPNEGGFKREDWLDTYKNKRSFTTTRKWLNIIFNECQKSDKIRLLETNLYNTASTRKNELAKSDKNTEVFNFLLKTIKPEAVIGHGKDIIQYLRHLSGKYYNKDIWKKLDLCDFSTKIYLRDHLSYHTSKKDCKELAKNFRTYLEEELK